MCGICGSITTNRIPEQSLETMIAAISHRGPDDQGIYIDTLINGTSVGFAQCRLSIMDLSAAGHQPMVSNDGSVVVSYNGEIYNFKEIRDDLKRKGYPFTSDCDTEVILYGYQEYGIDIVEKFNGMFAFALLDKRQETVYLVRDRMGVKPLYYYYDGFNLTFASELKAIMKYPEFKKEIDFGALAKYFACQYIPAPQTIFKNTYKLEPGSVLTYHNGSVEKSQYWNLASKFKKRQLTDFGQLYYQDLIEALLDDSIKRRLIADVPVGTFLSGGIDSSLITALAQKNSDKPINTFTIGFEEERYNEAEYAKAIAKHLGTNHYEEYCSINDAKKLLYEIPKVYDEPFADNSQLPTMLVSKLAKKHVTVALSGDAGDELFCGYKNYDDVLLQEKFLPISHFTSKLYKLHRTTSPLLWKVGKVMTSHSAEDILTCDGRNTADITNDLFRKELNINYTKNAFATTSLSSNIQEAKMLYDMQTYLPDDILVKMDRASMKYALEVRVPLLDYRLVEGTFSVPHKYKYLNGDKKYLLKQILYKYVPKELIERPKKGFSVPVRQWLEKDFNSVLLGYLEPEKIKKQGIFEEEAIRQLYMKFEKKHSRVVDDILWSMLVFQLWYDEYMKG